MYSANEKIGITVIGLGIVVILVSIPLILRKIKMNCAYGFRIPKAFESDENWYRVNAFGGKVLALWGIVEMIVGVFCFSMEPETAFTVSKVSFVSVLVPIVVTLLYSRLL